MEDSLEDLLGDLSEVDWSQCVSTATYEELHPPGWQEERIIKLETAILAKEKGFNWYVNTHYGETPVVSHLCLAEPGDQFGTPYEKKDYNGGDWMFKKYSAPTQSFLQKWLRDDKGILVSVEYTRQYNRYHFSAKTEEIQFLTWSGTHGKHETYEEALEEGLLKVLNKL